MNSFIGLYAFTFIDVFHILVKNYCHMLAQYLILKLTTLLFI